MNFQANPTAMTAMYQQGKVTDKRITDHCSLDTSSQEKQPNFSHPKASLKISMTFHLDFGPK